MTARRPIILIHLAAVVLTAVFWGPLWTGGGLIGGDTYTYYLPQKTFYADRLQAGEFPLWNNRVGHGYPVLGESQTGAAYPPYLLAYRVLDVNTAYNAVHLLHYVLAFVFIGLYVRRLGLGTGAALLAGVVFTYGWFPPRSCWEWAIVTGAWLPAALWCVESFLQSACWRYLIGLSTVLGLQLLAGHFNLAFITQLVLAAYVPLRLWFAPHRLTSGGGRKTAVAIACGLSLLCGFALGAVQLLPTLQLKQQSQRAVAGDDVSRRTGTGYDPGYGHLPPLYLEQLVLPWNWYSLAPTGELDGVLQRLDLASIDSATNKIEAHLYFGLLPLALIVCGITWRMVRRSANTAAQFPPRMLWLWSLLGIASIVYATGWLLPVARHLPGFSYFTGPGRFGIVATLAAAVISAAVLDDLLAAVTRRRTGAPPPSGQAPAGRQHPTHSASLLAAAVVMIVLAGTVYDLYRVSRLVTNAYLVDRPPIEARHKSRIARLVRQSPEPARLYAPGANLTTLTGAAATPVYLGIGPAAYFDQELRMPSLPAGQDEGDTLRAAPGQVDWLQRAGVTHVLSFKPLAAGDWPAELVYAGPDALLNPAWARLVLAPLYLYRLNGSRGRVALIENRPEGDRPLERGGQSPAVRISEYAANQVVIDVDSTAGGRLILTDLMYPGWQVTVDGEPAETVTHEEMYRAVDVSRGPHRVVWTYRPPCVYWGAALSLVALLLLAAVAHVRYWHPRLLPFFDQEPPS